ncbi:Transcriptional regulatory protein YpdB [Bacillus sp. THAF10]|uniref:LytR/AlgR family response regulator transcription factor n=1 Tax=Bacillus sp. THAF10 TaxID=2587848 RepID=UPI0012695602|nr:LytTR family DNA-binding domain-containing protein [Bacillus sp. THAF10]QFT90361.1 Transcriptional regulatory protein YpdB [Bacillus sp. THAF10]
MKPINVLIVDDNQDSLEIISSFIGELDDYRILDVCNNGEELVDRVMKNKVDVLIADIQMPKKNGMEAIKECLHFQPHLSVIFVTGYEEFAVEAFSISAVDYILKPLEKFRLFQALEKAKSHIERTDNEDMKVTEKRLTVRSNSSTFYIPFDDIIFIEKSGKKCIIYTDKKTIETYENISEIHQQLNESFYRTHRSYVVNLKKLSHITPKNETYFAYFHNHDKYAHISKLKINEVQDLLA